MVDNNWEFALDNCVARTGTVYALHNNPWTPFSDCWNHGLLEPNNEVGLQLYKNRILEPMPLPHVAIQLGVYYGLCEGDPMSFV